MARWIRCSQDSQATRILSLLTKAWGMNPPGALISVVGYMSPNGGMEEITEADLSAIRQGLQTVSGKTHAWLVTDGSRKGASRVIGRALQSTDVACIGFLSWDEVQGRKQLVASELVHKPAVLGNERGRRDSEMLPNEDADNILGRAEAHIGDRVTQLVHEKTSRKLVRGDQQAQLEPNHTHFVLSDLKTPGHEGYDEFNPDGLTLRQRVEAFIRSHDLAEEHKQGTPGVVLLINGDRRALEAVWDALNRSEPIVVMVGTGGAADDIAEVRCGSASAAHASPSPRQPD